MRRLVSTLLVIGGVGCGNSPNGPRDADVPQDPPVERPIDAAALPPCANPVRGSNVTMRKINPVPQNLGGIVTLAVSPPLDGSRLLALRIDGVVRLFIDEVLQDKPFIDLSDRVTIGNELGFLGMVFHPNYPSNGRFFVYYTTGTLANNTLRDVVARCQVTADPNVADPASCVEVLSIDDPAVNHNGGMMEFGKDGYLYIGTGDGGGNKNSPRSQDPTLLLGKMLRIDVDHKAAGKEYEIPPDNPFAAGGGAPEIYMLGLRNPWRWSFDRETGDLWIGDVGAENVEEVDVLAPSEQPAANLGWSTFEASLCRNPPCDPVNKTFPKNERLHTDGWEAIIGGQVYRGTCFPDLVGWYFYGDNIGGKFAKARLNPDRTLEVVDLVSGIRRPVSFHEDARGEIYATDVSGFVYRLEASP